MKLERIKNYLKNTGKMKIPYLMIGGIGVGILASGAINAYSKAQYQKYINAYVQKAKTDPQKAINALTSLYTNYIRKDKQLTRQEKLSLYDTIKQEIEKLKGKTGKAPAAENTLRRALGMKVVALDTLPYFKQVKVSEEMDNLDKIVEGFNNLVAGQYFKFTKEKNEMIKLYNTYADSAVWEEKKNGKKLRKIYGRKAQKFLALTNFLQDSLEVEVNEEFEEALIQKCQLKADYFMKNPELYRKVLEGIAKALAGEDAKRVKKINQLFKNDVSYDRVYPSENWVDGKARLLEEYRKNASNYVNKEIAKEIKKIINKSKNPKKLKEAKKEAEDLYNKIENWRKKYPFIDIEDEIEVPLESIIELE